MGGVVGGSWFSCLWASSSDHAFSHSFSSPSPGSLGEIGGRDHALPRLGGKGPSSDLPGSGLGVVGAAVTKDFRECAPCQYENSY